MALQVQSECHFNHTEEVELPELIEIQSQPVARMANQVVCPHCHANQDVERVFTALAITESPEHLSVFVSDKYPDIRSLEQAQQVATRINLADTQKPFLICDDCGQPVNLAVKHVTQKMEVPVLMECPACSRNIDLRFKRDRDKILYTKEWPHVPFLHCNCKNKVLLPVRGRQAWRNIAFQGVCLLRKIRGA